MQGYSKNFVFAAACAGMAFFGICLISLGSVLPALTARFGLDAGQASSIVTFLPAGILAGSVFFGPFVDRFGYKFLLVFSSLLAAGGLIWIATGESAGPVRVAVFMMGFGGGILNGETNTLVSDISGEDRNSNLSFLSIFFGIGALGIPLLIGSLTGKYSFQAILIATGIFMIIITVSFLFIRFPLPKQAQGFPVRQAAGLLKEPLLLMLSLALFFQSGMEGLTNNWTTTFLEDAAGFGRGSALFALTYMLLGMTATRLLLGFILKKVNSLIVVMSGIAVIIGGTVLLITGLNEKIGVTMLGIGFAPVFPVLLGFIGTAYPGLSGTAFSIALFIALMGNTSLNWLMGAVSGRLGIGAFPTFLLICAAMMASIIILASKKIQSIIKNQSDASN